MKYLLIPLIALSLTACALLEPSTTSPPRTDSRVEVPVGEGAVVLEGTGEERVTTKADDVVDPVAAIGGTILPNPILWTLLAQLGHGAIGLVAGRRRQGEAS